MYHPLEIYSTDLASLCPWQALQQGGMFIFEGERCLFSHTDKATSDHADLQEVLGTALAGFGQADCGCPPPPAVP